jgi:septal ring factor EnvC (AmiA/AmiB activator)
MNQLEIKIAQLEKDRAKLLKENRKLSQKIYKTKESLRDLRDESPCFQVYFETKNGSHSELVATLQDEDMFYKCADVFISLAEKQRMIVTERECSCCDFDQIIDKL